MAARTECPKCHKVGFVRIEHVFTGRKGRRSCYCGACNYEWEVNDPEEDQAGPPPRKPRKGGT